MDQLEVNMNYSDAVWLMWKKHLFGENCFNNPALSPDKDEGKLEESDTAK